MKVLNLYEWAQALYLTGDAESQQYAKEIMDSYGAADELDELKDEINHQAKGYDGVSDKVIWLGKQAHTLGCIVDILDQHKLNCDPDDAVRELAENFMMIEGRLSDAGRLDDCDVVEAVLQLLDEVAKPAFDL